MQVLIILTTMIFAFVCTSFLIRSLKRPAHYLGLLDKPRKHKRHASVVPLVGGLGMGGGFLLSSMLVLGNDIPDYFGLFAAIGLLICVGVFDDLKELSARSRLLAQAMAALLMIGIGDVYLSGLGDLGGLGQVELGRGSVPFTIFCIVGVINALNMIDGLDGLAGGIALIAAFWLALLALSAGQRLDGVLLLLLIAVIAGFLYFNLPHPWCRQASVFMGDAGSMMLGGVLSWFLVDLSQGERQAFAPITAVWILALPLLDTVSLMCRRLLQGRNPCAADREHLHHALLAVGCSPAQTTALLLAASALLGGTGVAGWYLGVPDYLMFYAFIFLFSLYLLASIQVWRVINKTMGSDRLPEVGEA